MKAENKSSNFQKIKKTKPTDYAVVLNKSWGAWSMAILYTTRIQVAPFSLLNKKKALSQIKVF